MPQCSHCILFCLVCCSSCCLRVNARVNLLPQKPHCSFLTGMCVFIWDFRWDFCWKSRPHSWHLNGFSSETNDKKKEIRIKINNSTWLIDWDKNFIFSSDFEFSLYIKPEIQYSSTRAKWHKAVTWGYKDIWVELTVHPCITYFEWS